MNIGEKLRILRKGPPKYTLAQVSEATKLSVSFLSDVERGRTKPSLDTLERLSRFYRIAPEELLQGVEWDSSTPQSVNLPGFAEFIQNMQEENETLDQDVLEVLVSAEHRSLRRAITPDEWKQKYYTYKMVMGR